MQQSLEGCFLQGGSRLRSFFESKNRPMDALEREREKLQESWLFLRIARICRYHLFTASVLARSRRIEKLGFIAGCLKLFIPTRTRILFNERPRGLRLWRDSGGR